MANSAAVVVVVVASAEMAAAVSRRTTVSKYKVRGGYDEDGDDDKTWPEKNGMDKTIDERMGWRIWTIDKTNHKNETHTHTALKQTQISMMVGITALMDFLSSLTNTKLRNRKMLF